MYIPQSPKLFNRTLYDNIVYGLKRPPSKTQIIQTLESMNIDVLLKLDQKLVGMVLYYQAVNDNWFGCYVHYIGSSLLLYWMNPQHLWTNPIKNGHSSYQTNRTW